MRERKRETKVLKEVNEEGGEMAKALENGKNEVIGPEKGTKIETADGGGSL